MNEIMKRPDNVPQDALYNHEEDHWYLIQRNAEKVPIGKSNEWYPDGVLKEEVIYQGEGGDTYSYKVYNPAGKLWYEGTYVDGLLVLRTSYRCPESESAFKNGYRASAEVQKIEETKFSPEGHTLAFNLYDAHNKLVKEYVDKDNVYSDFEYRMVQINTALNNNSYQLAKKRYEATAPPSSKEDPENIKHYKFLKPIIAHFADGATPSLELFKACVGTKYETSYKLKDIVASGVRAYIQHLYNQGKIDEAIALIEKLTENKKLGKELENPLWEWNAVLLIKSGKFTLSSSDNYYIRCLKHLELAGKRTSISDFLMDTPEMKAYNQFLENIPKYASYKEINDKGEYVYELSFDSDVLWNGDFLTNDLNLYYPELQHVSLVIINGDFTVKGKISAQRDFVDSGTAFVGFHIKGDVETQSVKMAHSSFKVEGSLTATRFVYLGDIDTDNGKNAWVKKMINTPLFVIVGNLKLKHTGGFSENCVHIANESASHKYIKVHHPDNLRDDFYYVYRTHFRRLDFDKLLEFFESKQAIFKKGYDATASATAGWEKLEHAKQLMANNQLDAALKAFDALKDKEAKEQNLMAFERDYYKASIYTMQDENANASKIEKLCKAMAKLYKSGEISAQPRWEMLLFMSTYISKSVKNNDTKVLEQLSEFNKGDADYYRIKAELLWKQGKQKEALFPAYIALKHYGINGLHEIVESKAFVEFVANNESDKFVLPKGYKNKYDKAIGKMPFADLVYNDEDDGEAASTVVYKGDVFWNGKLNAIEEVEQFPEKVHCNFLVIFGDLYVKSLYLHQIDLFVTGNIFVDTCHQGDSTLYCMGNVFCKNDYIITSDIGGANTTILGNLVASVILARPDTFEVFGKVDPKTHCIGLKGFNFADTNISKVYTENDLQVDHPEKLNELLNELFDDKLSLTEMLKNGTLLK